MSLKAEQREHRYLRVADLHRLRHHFLSARRSVHGQYTGRHNSPQRGQGVEFQDYRAYLPGDPLSDIDWKLYGRTNKLFTRLFEHQSDMNVHLLVDASASMAYRGIEPHAEESSRTTGTRFMSRFRKATPTRHALSNRAEPISKYDQACRMAGALGFLSCKQQDRVALGIARDGLAHFHRPGGTWTHLSRMLDRMQQTTPAGQADVAQAIRELGTRIARKGLVIILSDLLEKREPIVRALASLAGRGHRVMVWQVLHADELKLPTHVRDAVFTDSETGIRARLNLPEVREAYQERMRRMLQGWRTGLHSRGIAHEIVATAVPYYIALEQIVHRHG